MFKQGKVLSIFPLFWGHGVQGCMESPRPDLRRGCYGMFFLFTSLLNSSRSDAFKIIKLKQISADSFPVHDSVKSPLSHKSESTPLGVIRSTHLSNICKANTNNQHAAKWSISLAKRRLFLTDAARPLNQIVASIGMKCDLVARLGKQSRLLRPHTPTPLLLPSFFLFFSSLSLSETLSKQFNHHGSWGSAAAALRAVSSSNHLVPQLQRKEARQLLGWPLWKSAFYPFLLKASSLTGSLFFLPPNPSQTSSDSFPAWRKAGSVADAVNFCLAGDHTALALPRVTLNNIKTPVTELMKIKWEGSGDVEAFGCEGGGKHAPSKRVLMWRFGSHLLSCGAFMMLGLSVNGEQGGGAANCKHWREQARLCFCLSIIALMIISFSVSQ